MERDGSGVSSLLGIDGFVVTGQLVDEASGEWWLAVETLEDRRGASPARCGRSVMDDAVSWYAIRQRQIAPSADALVRLAESLNISIDLQDPADQAGEQAALAGQIDPGGLGLLDELTRGGCQQRVRRQYQFVRPGDIDCCRHVLRCASSE